LGVGRIAAQRGHDLSMQESGRAVKANGAYTGGISGWGVSTGWRIRATICVVRSGCFRLTQIPAEGQSVS
jgi:hypothetical protein